MYTNLKQILGERGITVREYAAFLGIEEREADDKLSGREEFTYQEFKKTCRSLFPEYSADFLFAVDRGAKRPA